MKRIDEILEDIVKGIETGTKCCLCDGDIEVQPNGWTGGHNPEPLASSEMSCCDTCNATQVIPERLARALMK